MNNPWATSPFNPNQVDPLFQQHNQADPMNRFASSPWLTMASSAMNAMGQASAGAVPTANPIKDYQQAVVNQSLANQNRRKAAQSETISDQTIAMNRQKLDPFFEYNEAKRTGVIPQDMTYPEFQKIGGRTIDTTSAIKNIERREQYAAAVRNAKTPQERKLAEQQLESFDAYVRAPKYLDQGGGGIGRTGVGGGVDTVIDAEDATAANAAEAGAIVASQEESKTAGQQVNEGMAGARAARNLYVSAETMLNKTDEYLEQFSGDQPIETGFIEGMLLNTFGIGTEEIGKLNADSVHAALLNLGITNLAPVTENEFASVMKMWADISASPTANKGMLTSAKLRTERLMDTLRDEAIYNAGLVEEFGTEGQYNAFRRANQFVNDLLTDPTIDTGASTGGTEKKEPVRPTR